MMLFILGLVIFVGSGCQIVAAQSRLDDKDLQHMLENLSGDAKSFRSTFVQALKQSSIRKTSRQKDAENLAMAFQKQTAGIADQFKHTKKVPGLQEVSATADQIEKLISELQLNGETTVMWQKIKPELAHVESAFALSPEPTPAGSSSALSSPRGSSSAICSVSWKNIKTSSIPVAADSLQSVSLRNDGSYIQAFESGSTHGKISFILGRVVASNDTVVPTSATE
ncbi:MAG: hypothetical protein WDN23_11910 [Edaphobacter sp.]